MCDASNRVIQEKCLSHWYEVVLPHLLIKYGCSLQHGRTQM